MEENNSTKEINLLQLISLFFDWLKKLGKSILNIFGYLLRLLFRQKIALIIILIICFGISQYMARKSERVYKAESMAMIYGSDAQTARQVCKQLENSSPTNKLISLATKLSLPDSVAKNVVGISSYYVIDFMKDSVADMVDFNDNHSLKDTVNVRMRDRVYLQVLTKNIAQLPKVQTALLNYFNNNEILKSQFDIKKNELIQEIQICNTESHRIDSLAKVSYFKDSNSQLRFDKDKLLLGQQTKQLFYGELLRLQELKAHSEVKLSNYIQPVVLPTGLIVSPKPINGRMKYGMYSIEIGFAISLLLAGLIENLKKIITYLKK